MISFITIISEIDIAIIGKACENLGIWLSNMQSVFFLSSQLNRMTVDLRIRKRNWIIISAKQCVSGSMTQRRPNQTARHPGTHFTLIFLLEELAPGKGLVTLVSARLFGSWPCIPCVHTNFIDISAFYAVSGIAPYLHFPRPRLSYLFKNY